MRRVCVLVLLCSQAALPVAAGPAAAQLPVPTTPVALDGPSANIAGLSGLSIARDGTGGLVYLKLVSGVPHVFVSPLLGGRFQPPVQVDTGLSGTSSQPVITAGNGGVLLTAFINGGGLYVVDRASPTAAFPAPAGLAAGASDPAIAMSALGKAYIAFTVVGAGGHDVRAAYYNRGQWFLESAPLDANPSNDAGVGTGRPSVAVAGDGVAIVVWGEAGHIYSRRVWATSPSVVDEQADVSSLGGVSETASAYPVVASGGDSSYAEVAYQETFTGGTQQQSRVLMNRLHGSQYDGVTQPDGLSTPGGDSADEPQIAETEYGRGFVTSEHVSSRQLFAATLGGNGAYQGTSRIDTVTNAGAPNAVPVAAGLFSLLITWQNDPGLLGAPEIRFRYFNDSGLGPETVLSAPTLGPTDAARGLVAGGDVQGDSAVAWVQGTGTGSQIVAAQLYQPPGGPGLESAFGYSRTATPTLAWSPSRELWGPVIYTVVLDGVQIAQTSGNSVTLPVAPYTIQLADGPHSWQVTATNPAGLQSTSRRATIFVDTVAPVARVRLTGRRRAGTRLRINVTTSDAPAPLTPAQASGIASVLVHWGDRTTGTITRRAYHVYKKPGRYTVTVVVTDAAGNSTTVKLRLRLAPAAKAPAGRRSNG